MSTKPDPSPAEIAAECLLIQQTWTEAQRLSRLRADWRPAFTRCDGIMQAMAADDYDGHHVARAELQAMADT